MWRHLRQSESALPGSGVLIMALALSTVIARSTCDEAIQTASAEDSGLLRFARNDGVCGGGLQDCRYFSRGQINVSYKSIQRQLPCAAARLDLFLACDRVGHGRVQFVPDEELAGVLRREALHQPLAMLECTTRWIRGDARVDRPIAAIGEHVQARLLHGCS